jgi:hypothetical protein
LYCTWCAEIIEEVKLASLSLGEESKTKKKEKGEIKRFIFLFVYGCCPGGG